MSFEQYLARLTDSQARSLLLVLPAFLHSAGNQPGEEPGGIVMVHDDCGGGSMHWSADGKLVQF